MDFISFLALVVVISLDAFLVFIGYLAWSGRGESKRSESVEKFESGTKTTSVEKQEQVAEKKKPLLIMCPKCKRTFLLSDALTILDASKKPPVKLLASPCCYAVLPELLGDGD